MEKHPGLPSPHEPRIPITPNNGSENLPYRAARKSVTTTNTLPNNNGKLPSNLPPKNRAEKEEKYNIFKQ